jgi:cyclic dehypoxanthinyl futalosine synthase
MKWRRGFVKRGIREKVKRGERINEGDALMLFQEDDLIEIGKLADYVRMKKVSSKLASYVVYMNINYTNICVSMCEFCGFSKEISDRQAYLLDMEDIIDKIAEGREQGINAILLQGGLHPDLRIDYYEDLILGIKKAYPDLHIHGFSPPEIVHIAKLSALSIKEVLRRLRGAGLDSVPGGGAEILDDSIRKVLSPNKCSVDEWLAVMRAAHMIGMKSSATMMFGSIETYEERVNHLAAIRNLQDETRGFTAFIPWTYQPNRRLIERTELLKSPLNGVKQTTAVDYLKTVAISRIFLDNFDHIEASLVTQGPKIAQLALAFGADDIGSVMIEENVVRAAVGNSYISEEAELIYLIEEAGYVPAKRDVLYRKYEVKKSSD